MGNILRTQINATGTSGLVRDFLLLNAHFPRVFFCLSLKEPSAALHKTVNCSGIH